MVFTMSLITFSKCAAETLGNLGAGLVPDALNARTDENALEVLRRTKVGTLTKAKDVMTM